MTCVRALEIVFQEHRTHPIAPIAGPELERGHGFGAARHARHLVEENGLSRVLKRQQHAGNVAQGERLILRSLKVRSARPSKPMNTKSLPVCRTLLKPQVVVQADSRGGDPSFRNQPETSADLLLPSEQLSARPLGSPSGKVA